MYTINDIKKAQIELDEAINRPLSSFVARAESFFNDVPETREEAKAQFVAQKRESLRLAFVNVAEQKEKDEYVSKYGIEATIV